MIRHAGRSVSPLTVDHPGQRVSSHSCREKREQRVTCYAARDGLLPLADVPLGLRVLFACLVDIAAALVICVLGCPGDTVSDISKASRT
jgi:hypothetical protein